MTLAKFERKNWNYDADRIGKHNAETLMCI